MVGAVGQQLVLGVDIGTGSSKGVLVDLDGRRVATAVREHRTSSPAPGHVEMPMDTWWQELVEITRECLAAVGPGHRVVSVGVSGMGPCVGIADAQGRPLRPAVLYGVDARASEQIVALTAELGAAEVLERTGSALSTQAVGPKLAWLAQHEPEVFARARMLFMPSSWLVHRLTGRYVLDHHSASQSNPLYDRGAQQWYRPWADRIAPQLELPELLWPGEEAGRVTAEAAAATGLPEGTPVVAGTVDAWAEAVSVGAQRVGDLMLMYGTTMFLVHTTGSPVTAPGLWGTNGTREGTHSLAGGMATSGAITAWLRELVGSPSYERLLEEARDAGPGAGGLLMLPYFAGERTPVADPDARGVVAGLTTQHARGHLYRAALEATAMGVRHNVDALRAAGGDIRRVVAVGGGTQGDLWTQVVSDVTGLTQELPTTTVGASYGGAFLAAGLVADVSIDDWNPVLAQRVPDPALADLYAARYDAYRELYRATRPVVHALAREGRAHVEG